MTLGLSGSSTVAWSSFVSGSIRWTALAVISVVALDACSPPVRRTAGIAAAAASRTARTASRTRSRRRRRHWLGQLGRDPERQAGRLEELAAAPVALRRVLRQRPRDHRVDRRRKLRVSCARGRRLVGHMRPQHRHQPVRVERRLTRQALVEDAAERVLIAPRVDGPAVDLLRGDVVGRPHELARLRHPRLRRRLLRQAEIRQVHVLPTALARDQHVPRLHVTVDETPGMGRVQRLRHRGKQGERPHRLERPLLREQRPQIAALDEAHRDIQQPLRLARLVDRDHVRMVERSGEARLPQEPLPEPLVPRQIRGEQLQRHPPPQPRIDRPIDVGHPPAAEQRLDPVAGQLRPNPRIR
jgi:hypothetical protein